MYFSYDPEDGFEFHATEAEARKRADAIMEACFDYAAQDGWTDNMGEVCWGEVRQIAHETRRWDAEEGSSFDYMAEWELQDVTPLAPDEPVRQEPSRCQVQSAGGAQCLHEDHHAGAHVFREDTAAIWKDL